MNAITQLTRKYKNAPIMVWLLLAIQIAVFVLMTLDGMRQGMGLDGTLNTGLLVKYGAMYKYNVFFLHEYWRFVTPMFIHIGFLHLAVNSVTLYFTGIELEKILGHWRFLLLYLLSGIAGNVLSFGFGSLGTVSAGASTAIFGMFGVYVALGRVYRHNPMIQYMARNMLMLVVMNLVMNIFSSGIDILGHLGGVLGGLCLGFVVRVKRLEDPRFGDGPPNIHRRIISGILFVFMLLLSLAYAYKKLGMI